MKVGQIIKENRKLRGLTQAELGDIVGVSHATIARYESDEVSPPLKVLERLSKALRIRIIEPEADTKYELFVMLCNRLGYSVEILIEEENVDSETQLYTKYLHVYNDDNDHTIKYADALQLIEKFTEHMVIDLKAFIEAQNNGKAEENNR